MSVPYPFLASIAILVRGRILSCRCYLRGAHHTSQMSTYLRILALSSSSLSLTICTACSAHLSHRRPISRHATTNLLQMSYSICIFCRVILYLQPTYPCNQVCVKGGIHPSFRRSSMIAQSAVIPEQLLPQPKSAFQRRHSHATLTLTTTPAHTTRTHAALTDHGSSTAHL